MQTKDFYFDLPEDLIAQEPSAVRGRDRLLQLDRNTGAWADHEFADLVSLIDPGTLMVFNDSRVRKARIYATADSSGNRTEFLLISRIHDLPGAASGAPAGTQHGAQAIPSAPCVWKAMVRNAKRHKSGRTYTFADGTRAEIIADPQGLLDGTEFRYLQFDRLVDDSWLDAQGHLPLPPYIRRDDSAADQDRYQTVYARTVGSVAAPTAGLHFTPEILASLDERGIERRSVTLHVGLGTFLPVRSVRLEDHKMHSESFSVSGETALAVTQAKREGRPVLAVGTTSIRTLESAWNREDRILEPGERDTSIFIYPGYEFAVVDQVFTNFHTPESTLLMLVSAFAGKERIFEAYRHAVESRYRFFSYGDSMLIR